MASTQQPHVRSENVGVIWCGGLGYGCRSSGRLNWTCIIISHCSWRAMWTTRGQLAIPRGTAYNDFSPLQFMQNCKGYITAIQLIQVYTLLTYRVRAMKGYTNKKCRVRTHNYKKKGATCDLKVVILVAVRATWGRLFQTETNWCWEQVMTENNWCGQEVGIRGVNCKEFYLSRV